MSGETDIVERLRSELTWGLMSSPRYNLILEAANEIERLRALSLPAAPADEQNNMKRIDDLIADLQDTSKRFSNTYERLPSIKLVARALLSCEVTIEDARAHIRALEGELAGHKEHRAAIIEECARVAEEYECGGPKWNCGEIAKRIRALSAPPQGE